MIYVVDYFHMGSSALPGLVLVLRKRPGRRLLKAPIARPQVEFVPGKTNNVPERSACFKCVDVQHFYRAISILQYVPDNQLILGLSNTYPTRAHFWFTSRRRWRLAELKVGFRSYFRHRN